MMTLPAHIAEREPTEAAPTSPMALSPCRCSILSASMPRWPASRRENTVAWPWPVDCTLQPRISFSSPGNATEAISVGIAPECSSMQETPMPRYFLRLAAGALALVKLSKSASLSALSTMPGKSPLS